MTLLTWSFRTSCKTLRNNDHKLHVCISAGSVKRLLLKDNSLSDAGLRRMTAPVRVLKKGLDNLLVLDLSCKCSMVSQQREPVSFLMKNLSSLALKEY